MYYTNTYKYTSDTYIYVCKDIFENILDHNVKMYFLL